MLLDVNPFAATLQSAAERLRHNPSTDLCIRISGNASREGRQYAAPACAEVAVIIPGDQNSEQAAAHRDVMYITKQGDIRHINETHSFYDPLHYVLLFPRGDLGWHPRILLRDANADDDQDVEDNDAQDDDDDDDMDQSDDEQLWSRTSRSRVTTRQYYAFMLQIRENTYIFFFCGRLLLEYIVDNYAKLETQRLKYLRLHQNVLRADVYSGAADAVFASGGAPVIGRRLGTRIILLSSFTGGPRYMHQQFQDAMGIVRGLRKPDLFITFTCNPRWPNIVSARPSFQTPSDKLDIVCCIFHEKLNCLLDDLKKKKIFGTVLGRVYVVEFQKRGLPHAHILLILDKEDKPTTKEDSDAIVCAELPDPNDTPRLYDTVIQNMVHGPCGIYNPSAPCMDKSERQCTKRYPKPFREETEVGENGYVLYCRRDNRHSAPPSARPGHPPIDNTWIVPYNKYLCLKYNAHINVEICTSVQSVKYVYKGHDRANMRVEDGADDGNGSDNVDGITAWQDSRYISATECTWRLFGYRIHGQWPPICRLDVHLPDMQRIVFREDADVAAVLRQRQNTKLTARFNLNQIGGFARTLLYTEIPKFYSFRKSDGTWRRRTRSAGAIGRLYFVQSKDAERYALRLILLKVRGATSFSYLKTINGIRYEFP